MSKSIRINTTPNGSDKYIKIKLEQDFDFLEVLSLNITQEDTYNRFSSDYGVIVGRVVINSGFGVPNAKVSVFIPLDAEDSENDSISGLYPYKNINDKNDDGVRYNLFTKFSDAENPCFTPIGSFPTKRDVLDNDDLLHVYQKYYRFTTTTNHAGDFMIFGVPLGTYVMHVDADISDIGIVSQRPYDLISKGTPISRFTSTTKFAGGTNLNNLVQVKSLDSGVTVQPFWGDTDSYEIGITRVDFDLNYEITPCAIFMGSIFGDSDKNSVNKNCRPRKKLGELGEQVTNDGTIRMIRKTLNNKVEEFSVDGGYNIDNDGAWAYQIPMNLDYMVTDETGNLILSQDPNIGLPTRARVRFNIGMMNTGGEGRLRTRARHLVPNNPTSKADIDYEFGFKTKEHSFRDLHWNKIYTVSNFITKFQRNNGLTGPLTRNATGIKNVDGDGSKNPFPFNKVNTENNPIFFVICLIMYIIIVIISLLNGVIFPIINGFLSVIKGFLGWLCGVKIWKWRPFGAACNYNNSISYIGCITIPCPFDEVDTYAPGCQGNDRTYDNTSPKPTYYNHDGTHNNSIGDVGLGDCVAFQVAKALGLFQFDFYNDWINGSLFSFLLKYKKAKNKKEKFCESNCNDLGGGGVDGNNDGKSDNDCTSNILIDSCIGGANGEKDFHKETSGYEIKEGLVKKVGDDFYYAATTKNGAVKLFATDIVNLGSVFDCDWQGIPKLQHLLIPTTYKLPPDTQELSDDQKQIEVTGMIDIGGSTCGNFFDINCLGLHTNEKQCLNIRHLCEMGVDLDQPIIDVDGKVLSVADCVSSSTDIDDNNGIFFRDVFYGLNFTKTPWIGMNSFTLPNSISTAFNTKNIPVYNFVDDKDNGKEYSDFKNYTLTKSLPPTNNSGFGQPDNSYFFYFGLLPGKTGLDKMNQRFFTSCEITKQLEFGIISDSNPDSQSVGVGSITFNFVGGSGPYTYTFKSVTYNTTPITGIALTSDDKVTINNLFNGTYTVTANDLNGEEVIETIIVNGPMPVYCFYETTKLCTTDSAKDGEITIKNVGGGKGSLTYSLISSDGKTNRTGLATTGLVIGGLGIDPTIGYSITTKDSGIPASICTITGLTMTGRKALVVTPTTVNARCSDSPGGEINIEINGGQAPYTATTTGPNNFKSKLTSLSFLEIGNYTITVVDASLETKITSVQLNADNPLLVIEKWNGQSTFKSVPKTIAFYIKTGVKIGDNTNVEYTVDGGKSWIPNNIIYSGSSVVNYMTIFIPEEITDDGVSVRYWVDKYPVEGESHCYSDNIFYEKGEIKT